MKTFSALILLLASSCSAFELNEIGIRVIVNGGVAHESCSEAEQDHLKSTVQDALPRQRLRNSAMRRRYQAACSELCTDMTNCFVLHPQCRGAVDEPEDTDDDLAASDVLFDPEFTFGQDELSGCAGKKSETKNQLKGFFTSESVSQTCKSFVKASIHLECVVVDHEV